MWRWLTLGAAWIACCAIVRADVTLLLEEPFGGFWSMNPAHSAIYLSRVCADSPVALRRCKAGENGVVISRYHRISGYDWVAIPVIPYLYVVDRAEEVPSTATREQIAELRDAYRRSHLEKVAPDQSDGSAPQGDWTQLVGEAYDRSIYGFTLPTTESQDDLLIQDFNSRPNRKRFNLLFQNCANFAMQVIDTYYPKSIHRAIWPEFGIMTPRQAAKCMIRFGQRHPELQSSAFVIAQVRGPKPRSKTVNGILALWKPRSYRDPPFGALPPSRD